MLKHSQRSANADTAEMTADVSSPLEQQQRAGSLMKDVMGSAEDSPEIKNDHIPKKRPIRPISKRAHSATTALPRDKLLKQSLTNYVQPCASVPEGEVMPPYPIAPGNNQEKGLVMPRYVVAKVNRLLTTRKRDFMKLRKNLIALQNTFLENFAQLKELEARANIVNADDSLGEVRVLSVTGWPAHDLLMLVRDDLDLKHSEIGGVIGPHALQQMTAQLKPIPEEMMAVAAELMARRIDLLNQLMGKSRNDRPNYLSNIEWKAKNTELDQDTEKLNRMVAGTAENLKAKINYILELAKIPWVDRDTLTKKIDRLQKEILILQHKYDENSKKDFEDAKEGQSLESLPYFQALNEELSKERAAREALKEVVSAAEGMLRVARARIATLERQLKETRTELETTRKKHKDLEQLYRYRESNYDARSKRLIEVSKTGEMAVETLSRQRDALELRVKELRELAENAEKLAASKVAEQRARAEFLQAKVAEQLSLQEKAKAATEGRVMELDAKVKELEEQLQALRERSIRLVDMERKRCLEYVPSKENEPTDQETEIWKELQATRMTLSRVEEELRQSRADKDSFLNSLSRIAQEGSPDTIQEKIAIELLDREQKILKLQRIIEEHQENEKSMEQTMTHYEDQIASLRLEVRRLRNYDGYSKEVPYQDLETELLELHMQVETLSRERTALVTAAASRALMLERHERSAELFARMVQTRRDLAALLQGNADPPPPLDEAGQLEVSRSLTTVCATAADTWTALRAERARVLRLESAVLAQSLQLEREGRARTQLERRRSILEREIMRTHPGGLPNGYSNCGNSWI